MAGSRMQSPSLETGPMTHEVLKGIFASDQDMYPAPLTWERLESWTRAAPELSMCFYLPGNENEAPSRTLVGAVIALPILASSWRHLLVGQVKETDVEPDSMFPRNGDQEEDIGLHIFHIEKFDTPDTRGRVPGFAGLAMGAVVEVAAKTRWKVIGHSALTATPEGRRAFDKMGFQPTGYEEFWVSSDSSVSVELLTISAETTPQPTIPEGEAVKGHATMLAKHLSLEDTM